MNSCLLCGKELLLENRKYCNQTCSTKHLHIKRKELGLRHPRLGKVKLYYCICGEEKQRKSERCKVCIRKESLKVKTKEELLDRYSSREQGPIQIRKQSRRLYLRSNKPKECLNCGYSKNFQICHIKGIGEFENSSTIEEINNIDNLIALCPNCHWEYDHGLLKL